MKARWNRLISLFGVAVMLTTSSGLVALAEEETQEEEQSGSGESGTTTTEETEKTTTEESEKTTTEETEKTTTEESEKTTTEETEKTTTEESEKTTTEETEKTTTDTPTTDTTATDTTTQEPTTTDTITSTSTNGDTDNSNVGNDAVYNMQWGDKDTAPGKALFNTTLSKDTKLTVELLKYNSENGELDIVTTRQTPGATNETINLNWDIDKDGYYTFIVEGEGKKYQLDDSNYWFKYSKPDATVASVKSEDTTVSSDGTLTWNSIDNVEYYVVMLYEGNEDNVKKVEDNGTSSTSYKFSNIDENQDYYYYAIIKSCSANINDAANSYSDKIWIRKVNKLSSDSNTNTDNNNSASSGTEEESSSSTSTSVATTPLPTIGNSTGWGSLANAVDKAITDAVANATTTATTTAVVNIKLNGVDTVPAKAINAIAGKDVVLSLSVDAKTLVTIDGSQLTAADVSDVKLVSGKAADGSTTLNVRAGNANIEKSIVVYSNIGADKVGREAALYFVNADQSLVEFRTSPVYENGYAAFNTPLVSANYKIAVK
jgi:hypothetical protein